MSELGQKDERINELEDELLKYKRFIGSEFADIRKRFNDLEEQAQSQATNAQPTDSIHEDTATAVEE